MPISVIQHSNSVILITDILHPLSFLLWKFRHEDLTPGADVVFLLFWGKEEDREAYLEPCYHWCSSNPKTVAQVWELTSSLVAQLAKICLQCRRPRFKPWVKKIPWRRKWQRIPVFLPGKFHGQRRLAGYSPGVARAGHDLVTKPPPPFQST